MILCLAAPALPSVKITIAPEDFNGVGGIETDPALKGEKATRPVLIRFKGFDKFVLGTVPCGMLLHGASSRTQSSKHSYRLKFRKAHGVEKLSAPIFGRAGVTQFDELLLRNPTHDSWTVKQETWRENSRYVNDQWCRQTMKLLGHRIPRARWVEVFINERYWGLYLLSELPDEHFMSSSFGGEDEDYLVIRSGETKHGTSVAYDRFLSFLQNPKLKGAAAMTLIERYLKADQFIDYFLVQAYAVNADWPKKNYAVTGQMKGAACLRFFTWDSETAFFERWHNVRNPSGGNALDYDQFSDVEFISDQRGPAALFRRLIEIPGFKLRFEQRVKKLVHGNGLLSPQSSAKRYRALLDFIEPHLMNESQRWGNAANPEGVRYGPETSKWKKLTGPQSWLFTEFFPQRSEDLLQDLHRHNFILSTKQ